MTFITGGSVSKESACSEADNVQCRKLGFDPWVGKLPWRRKWQPFPVFLPGKSHGQRSLVELQFMGLQRAGHDLEIEYCNLYT